MVEGNCFEKGNIVNRWNRADHSGMRGTVCGIWDRGDSMCYWGTERILCVLGTGKIVCVIGGQRE